MTITIEVGPEAESALSGKARRRGLNVQEYVRHVLEREALAPDDTRQSGDSFEAELDALLEKQPDARAAAGLGSLPDDAVEDAYREREAAQL